jgi:3-dehydroquinate synthetase
MNAEYLSTDRLELVERLSPPRAGVIICDVKLQQLYPDLFAAHQAPPTLALKAGERHKNWKQCQAIYSFLSENKVCREDIVHVFGGGTITDLAAFAVSTFKRGCRLHLYPTTLMGMIDAAIGGKTGFNQLGFKNHIGCFYPAERIVIHTPFLQSLPKAELRQGYAEMLKYTMLNEQLLLPDLSRIFPPRDQLILDHARYKMQICASDPHDHDQRQILNFGHTFGHALEALSGFKIKHGDAVVLGMYIACEYSFEAELSSFEEWEQYRDWILQYPIPQAALRFLAETSLADMLPKLQQDKKTGKQLRLVLPIHGQIKLIDVKIQPKQRNRPGKNNANPA